MDIAEISEIVTLYGKSVYGFCYMLTKNKSDTEDLYQETFLKATELCHKIDKDNNPRAFLISIAIGLWKNRCRKNAIRQKIAPVYGFNEEDVNNSCLLNDASTPEDIVITNEIAVMVRNAADTLNIKLKIPLYMYYTAEMSIEEIALSLKIPEGTVKSRLYKARNTLKNILEVK